MRRLVRCIEYFLFAAGLVILGYCGAWWLNSRVQQANGNRELDRILSNRAATSARGTRIPDGDLVGKVEIPDLRLSAVIFQGTQDSVLDQGVGHVDGTALPGQPGNVVLAAHRDTFFRSLRNIRKGEVVRVTTPSGTRDYEVDSTEIVDPTQVQVMDPTPTPSLTLITCYPFYFVGHAPKRFIVRARDTGYQAPQMTAGKTVDRKTADGKTTERKASLVIEPLSPEDTQNLTYIFTASEEPIGE